MLLYTTPLSSFSCKVRLAIALKGCAVEERMPPGGGYRSSEYRAIVPHGRIPALVEGDFVLGESDAIIEYLDETRSGPDVLPADPRMRAIARFLSRYHDFYLDPPVRALFPELDPRLRSAERVDIRVREIIDRLADLEDLVSPAPFLAGTQPSLADCAFPATLVLIEVMLPRLGIDVTLGPKMNRWWETIQGEARFDPVLNPYRAVSNAWAASKLASP